MQRFSNRTPITRRLNVALRALTPSSLLTLHSAQVSEPQNLLHRCVKELLKQLRYNSLSPFATNARPCARTSRIVYQTDIKMISK